VSKGTPETDKQTQTLSKGAFALYRKAIKMNS